MHMDLSKDHFDFDSQHKNQHFYKWSAELIMVQSLSQQYPLSSFENDILNDGVGVKVFNQVEFYKNQQVIPTEPSLQANFSEGIDQKQVTGKEKMKRKIKAATGCQCKKTECIKSYCECYSKGDMCSEGCNCMNCKNNPEHIELVQQIKKKKSKNKSNQSGHKCQCNKSRCLKKYCECYNAGVPCGVYCKCDGCQNAEDQTEQS